MVVELVNEKLREMSADLSDDVDMGSVCFADDTTILHSASSQSNIQASMNVASGVFAEYFASQGMKVNQSKEEHIIFTAKGCVHDLPDGVVVDGRKEADQVKLLGIVVQKGYKFDNHVSSIISRVSYRIAHLRRLRRYMSMERLKQVVDSLAFSILRFGIEFAGRDLKNLKRLQRTMNVLLRLITKSNRLMSVRYMLSKTGLLNCKLQYIYQRAALMRRVIRTGSSPRTLSYVVSPRPFSRLAHFNHSMSVRTKYGQNSIVVTSLETLNQIGYLKKCWQGSSSQDPPGKQWFDTATLAYLKSNLDNANL